MSNDINLVNKVTSAGSREVRLKKIRVISFSTLIIVAILSVLIFLINLRFSASYVVSQQNKLIQKLSVYDETKSKIIVLNQHVSGISSILNSRKKYNETAAKIIKNDTKPTLVLETFAINNGGISISFSSPDLKDLDLFLNHMIDLNKKKVINSVTLENLSMSLESGDYKMTILAN